MSSLPTEIINKHPFTNYIEYLYADCYEEDYNPYYAENWLDNYCFYYSFSEWYFMYRRIHNLEKYVLTPNKLIIGAEYLHTYSYYNSYR